MDSREREARDHRYEEFVLEQVRKYGDMEAKVSKVYIGCAVACVALCLLGIIFGKPFFKCLFIGMWSLGFWAAKLFYQEDAKQVGEAAEKIRAAIDDPDFDIPDNYPEDILALRRLVCPTLKNVCGQAVAYGIIAVSCWAGAILILWLSTSDSFSPVLFIAGVVMGAMALMLSFLSVRAIKDIPVAKAYEQYLNDAAAGE